MVDEDARRRRLIEKAFEVSERARRQAINRHLDAIGQARYSEAKALAEGGARVVDRLVGRAFKLVYRKYGK